MVVTLFDFIKLTRLILYFRFNLTFKTTNNGGFKFHLNHLHSSNKALFCHQINGQNKYKKKLLTCFLLRKEKVEDRTRKFSF